jgi:tRNA A58 N-methylase Trm61
MDPPYYFVFPKLRSRVFFERADYHAKDGIIRAEAIGEADSGDELTTHLGVKARIYHATATDVIESFSNGPQNITLKDAAYIIGRCGVMRDSRVIEAGTGSGSLTAFLSLYAKRVVSFELRDDFAQLARKNLTPSLLDRAWWEHRNARRPVRERAEDRKRSMRCRDPRHA